MNSKYDIFYYLFILNYSVLSFQAHDNILPFNTDQNCCFYVFFQSLQEENLDLRKQVLLLKQQVEKYSRQRKKEKNQVERWKSNSGRQ